MKKDDVEHGIQGWTFSRPEGRSSTTSTASHGDHGCRHADRRGRQGALRLRPRDRLPHGQPGRQSRTSMSSRRSSTTWTNSLTHITATKAKPFPDGKVTDSVLSGISASDSPASQKTGTSMAASPSASQARVDRARRAQPPASGSEAWSPQRRPPQQIARELRKHALRQHLHEQRAALAAVRARDDCAARAQALARTRRDAKRVVGSQFEGRHTSRGRRSRDVGSILGSGRPFAPALSRARERERPVCAGGAPRSD